MKIETHRVQPMGVTTLMYVGDSGDGLGDVSQPSYTPWFVLGGVLLALGLWLGKSNARR